MRYSIIFTTTLAAGASAHSVIRSVTGANGVTMPGLGIADGTPRNCVVNACGAQADTSIIRDSEIASGQYPPLGWSQGHGAVYATTVMDAWMGKSSAPTNSGASGATGVEDNLVAQVQASAKTRRDEKRSALSGLFNLPIVGTLGLGGTTKDYPTETLIGDNFGKGLTLGLPTTDDNGQISAVYRQVNQDGAGPLTASVDGTSGGTVGSAFKSATMPLNMPGSGISGLSIATNTDFPITIKMPAGMTCEGTVSGVKNVCIGRVRNQALAGPFGGSFAFTQSTAARKRAIAYRLKKREELGHEEEA